jgi:hypothetical protein
MLTQAGQPFEAVALNAAPGLAGQLTVEVYDPTDGASIIAPTTVGITEPRPGSYRALLTVPVAGTYSIRWHTPDGASAEELLEVTAGPVVPPAVDFRPTVADVALVTPAYTRGGFDDDSPQSGAEQNTYTSTTSPTAEHVEGLITAACDEVGGRVGLAVAPNLFPLARRTAVWHVAAAIAASKQPAHANDVDGEYRGFITNYRACLDELTKRARQPTAMRLA